MIGYGRRFRLLAILLAALAGYVDAIGFLKLGGLFVSFMSGNSTRLAVGIARHADVVVSAGALIATFVVGVVAGSLVSAAAGRHRKAAVLALVAILLGCAAAAGDVLDGRPAIAAMTLAMGAANSVFQRDGEVSIGVTYMTGTLVKLGQRITSALLGGERWAWIPYLMLWLGLVSGAATGAALYPHFGDGALWIAAAGAGVLALAAASLGPRDL